MPIWGPNYVRKGERVYVIKDRFRKGYYSIHVRGYRGGKMSSERTYDYFKKKRDADKVANRLRTNRRP